MIPLRYPKPPPVQALLLWQSCTLIWLMGLLAARWPLPALVCLVCVFWVDSRLWRPALAVSACCIYALGWLLAQALLPAHELLPAYTQGAVRLSATVARVQSLPDARLRIFLDTARPAHNAAQAPIAKVAWTWDKATQSPLPGQQVEVSLALRTITGFRNPGLSDSAQWWAAQGVTARAWSRGDTGNPIFTGEAPPQVRIREALALKLHHILGQGGPLTQAQAFIPALLLGDRSHLHSTTMERMAGAGLAHSLALSGQHLSVVALLALVLIRLWAVRWPQIYLVAPRIKLVAALSLPLALLYLWLGGAPASLVRASCMLLILTMLLWRNALLTLMDALIAAVLAITCLWPLGVFDTGLQLSVLCVGALALFMPWLRRLPTPAAHAPMRWLLLALRRLCLVLLASCSIQVVMLPIFLLIFGFASPWFVLNVVWLPVLGCIVLPCAALGMLLLAAGAESLAQGALWCATVPCIGLLEGLEWLAQSKGFTLPALMRPHWTALPAWAALVTAVALVYGRTQYPAAGRRLLIVGIVLLCVGPALRVEKFFFGTLHCTVLDVGQGQAIYLRLPNGHTVLVDGGGSAFARFDPGRSIVGPSISYNAAPRLSHVFNTHPDVDHSKGLVYILNSFDVHNFWHNGQTAHSAKLQQLFAPYAGHAVYAGRVFDLGDNLRLEVLHPPPAPADTALGTAKNPAAQWTDNNASLVLRLVRDNRGLILLTGDAEMPALRALVASGQDLRAEVLVLPHHGSQSSLLESFYDAVAPRLALVSCGQDNRYGYPARDVVRAMERRNVPVFSTARAGALEVWWDAAGTLHTLNAPLHAE